jgi:phage tail sheath protein FI
MPTYRTPGVYVEEVRVFPPSIAEVESAIPVFVGYTEKARLLADDDLNMKPTVVRSYTQFQQYFGDPEGPRIDVVVTRTGNAITSIAATTPKVTYDVGSAMKMYFDNGGGKCYVVSVGKHPRPAVGATVLAALKAGLATVETEDEPTLIVVPESTLPLLSDPNYAELVQAMLAQCAKLKDRFAILDVRGGEAPPATPPDYSRPAFVGELSYGAAYYPFVRTTMNPWIRMDESNVMVAINGAAAVPLGPLKGPEAGVYNAAKAEIAKYFVALPPSAVMAGVYAATDSRRGVWKSPANVGLLNVIEPCVKLTDDEQEEANHEPVEGKSINVLRSFSGRTVVWGARTLAGNDNEWRYISVRRFFIMVEESVKKSTGWAVFEPNDANTWTKVRGMIEAYLTQKWREGALAGATPRDAFYVRCGLGSTMNSQDILEGRMNVEIGLAVVRPAEFIVLKFSHKLQTS